MNIVVQEQTQGSLEGILRKLSHSILLLSVVQLFRTVKSQSVVYLKDV